MTLKIGDTLYYFDGNRRVYPRTKDGRQMHGSPIYAEHYVPVKIVGETRVSWLLEYGWKASKRSVAGSVGPVLTKEAMEDDVWCSVHRFKIRDLFDRAPAPTVRRVADILGYKPE